MVELIKYLQANKFEVYICSGSDPQFTRSFCREVINISKNNVIGTTILTKWDGKSLVRQHEFVQAINDGPGKPVNILNKIGKIPVIAVGNSTGDYHMLEYSKTSGHSLQMIVNHDDDEIHEYKYKDDQMKKLCEEKNWQVISMKNDFKKVFDLKK